MKRMNAGKQTTIGVHDTCVKNAEAKRSAEDEMDWRGR